MENLYRLKRNYNPMFLIIIVFIVGALIFYNKIYNWGLQNGIESGTQQGLEEGVIRGGEEMEKKLFNEAFANVTELYRSSDVAKIITLSPMKIELDYRGLVKQLSVSGMGNTSRNRESFSGVLKKVHTAILDGIALNLEFKESDRSMMHSIYDSIHPEITKNYHVLYMNSLESERRVNPIQERKGYNAAVQFNLTVSESICHLIDGIATLAVLKKFPAATRTPGNLLKWGGKIGLEDLLLSNCTNILNSIFPRMSLELREAGAYYDMQNTRILFNDYLRKSIAEIATVKEVIGDLHISKQIDRKIFGNNKTVRKWIKDYFDSHATVELTASASIKAGIDIDDYFNYEVFPERAMIQITVHEPKILSREVFPNYSKVENGYLIHVNEKLLNDTKNELLLKLNQVIDEGDILTKAKINFEQFFEAVILPTIKHSGIRNVKFKYIQNEIGVNSLTDKVHM